MPASPDGLSDPNGSQPPGRVPPPQAIAACTTLSTGDSCTFTSPRGTETGTCQSVQNQRACAPGREQPPPPQEQ
ncbi:MAG: hypothetical protein KDE29_04060 [Anaerolineales bacterium]|nr:hypothetical protein [Anaerolineales bacterium]